MKPEYALEVRCWEQNFILSQPANTTTGGKDNDTGEELKVIVHDVPGGSGATDKFIVFETRQWSIDKEDIDKFAEWLKSLCEEDNLPNSENQFNEEKENISF